MSNKPSYCSGFTERNGELIPHQDLIASQVREIEELETKVDQLEWEVKGVAEWRDEALRFSKKADELRAALFEAVDILQDASSQCPDDWPDLRKALTRCKEVLK
jgi:vacuolar-type H+-ATPase subunit I/STV1